MRARTLASLSLAYACLVAVAVLAGNVLLAAFAPALSALGAAVGGR